MTVRLGAATAIIFVAVYASRAQPAAPPASPALDEIVAARRAAMDMSAVVLGTIENAVERGAKADTQVFETAGLARWGSALPGTFPAGAIPDARNSHARREVSTDRPGFEKSAAAFTEATTKLRDLAKVGDTAGFRTQVAVVHKLCESCHDGYRAK